MIRSTAAAPRRWLVVSIAAFVASAVGFGAVFERLTGTPLEPITLTASSPLEVAAGTLLLVGLLVLVVVPHELLHGLCLARYGGDPGYGVDSLAAVSPSRAYATSETVYTRNEMLVTVLAPFVGITVAGLGLGAVLGSPLVIVPLAANAAGSVGDLRTAVLLARYPATVRVTGLPEGDGLAVYGPSASRPPARGPVGDTLAAALVGAAGTVSLTVGALFATVAASLAAGSGTVAVGDPDGPWYRFLFRHQLVRGEYGASLEVGAPALAVLALGGGLAWAIVDRIAGSDDGPDATSSREP